MQQLRYFVRRSMLSTTALVALVACGTQSAPPPGGGGGDGLRDVGFVLLSEGESLEAPIVTGVATFVRRNGRIEEAWPSSAFDDGDGTCEVLARGGGATPSPLDDTLAGSPIGAGAALTVRRDGSGFATFGPAGTGTYLLTGGAATQPPLPDDGLTLNVPGGVFPSFTGAAFPEAAPLAFDDPGTVTSATGFEWRGSDVADSAVIIVGGDDAAVFQCVVRDDGSFSFDAATRRALTDAGFGNGSLSTVGRMAVRSTTQGDAVLMLGVLRTATLPLTVPAAPAGEGE